MGRPADWSPLADGDPVPGDPDEVAALGRRFRATAAAIEQASERLRTMCTDEFWESDAGVAFRSRSVDTAGKLAKAYDRYHAAATALGTDPGDTSGSSAASPRYAGSLQHAQQLSRQALTSAQDAAAAQRQAMSQLQTAIETGTGHTTIPGALDLSLGALTPDSSGHLPIRPSETAQVTALKGHYNQAADQLGAARTRLARAEQIRDQAASNASALISYAIGHDGLTDGFWDHVTNFIDEHAGLLSTISKVAGWVASIAGTLALCVGWIPIIGQALAAVLGTLALIASVVTLLADVLLMIGGQGSWFDVALDVIAVASFGLGRAATGAVKDSALLARGTAVNEGPMDAVKTLMSGSSWLEGGEEGLERDLTPMVEDVTTRAGDLDPEELSAARLHAPGAWPDWGAVLRGFHPVSILQDGFHDIGDLKPSNWAKLGDGGTWKDAKFFVGDPEIREAVAKIGELGDWGRIEGVSGFVTNVARNHAIWNYVTVPAVAADWANHVLTASGLKDPLLTAVGLGSAAG
ncbi:MAG: hypothetical protein JO016_12055 [Actinobacteria bacterium]|nr:hypothetical protein [Actinomycetota bacterium]